MLFQIRLDVLERDTLLTLLDRDKIKRLHRILLNLTGAYLTGDLAYDTLETLKWLK